MALTKDRTRASVKGLGTLSVRETSPSVGTAFEEVGSLDGETGTNLEDFVDVEEIVPETGVLEDVKEKSRVTRLTTNLLQTTLDEINLAKASSAKTHALRYYGSHSPTRFQYFCIPRGRIAPSVALGFRSGKRVLPLRAWALKQSDLSYDVPEYYVAETRGVVRIANLQLWINPRDIYSPERTTNQVFDISGFERHGSLNSDYASIWSSGTPESFLVFDGVNDVLSFGDILDDDGVSDLMFEIWVKILGADGTTQRIMSKKESTTASSKGFQIYRHTNNEVVFGIADGTTSVINNMPSTLLQNTWCHVVFTMDRNGNVVGYKNGVAGSGVSVAAVTSGANAIPLKIASLDTAFANIQTGGMRIYNFGAGGLPSNIATVIANNYAAEKAYYGL